MKSPKGLKGIELVLFVVSVTGLFLVFIFIYYSITIVAKSKTLDDRENLVEINNEAFDEGDEKDVHGKMTAKDLLKAERKRMKIQRKQQVKAFEQSKLEKAREKYEKRLERYGDDNIESSSDAEDQLVYLENEVVDHVWNYNHIFQLLASYIQGNRVSNILSTI